MERKETENTCIVCHGPMRFLLEGIDLNFTKTGNKFAIYRCEKCGLEAIKPQLTNSDLAQDYPKNYYSYTTKNQLSPFEKIIYKTLDDVMNKKTSLYTILFKNRIQKFPHYKTTTNTYLDIGCGDGKNLGIVEKYGWDVQGFEIGEPHHTGKIIYDYHIKNIHWGRKFDFISLWAVFEHLIDPIGYLETIKTILAPKGEVHILIPNNNGLYARLFGKYWVNRDIPRHVYNYNPASIKLLLEKYGFEVNKITHLGSGGFTVSLYQYLEYKYNIKLGFLRHIVCITLFYPFDCIINALGLGDLIHIKFSNK